MEDEIEMNSYFNQLFVRKVSPSSPAPHPSAATLLSRNIKSLSYTLRLRNLAWCSGTVTTLSLLVMICAYHTESCSSGF